MQAARNVDTVSPPASLVDIVRLAGGFRFAKGRTNTYTRVDAWAVSSSCPISPFLTLRMT